MPKGDYLENLAASAKIPRSTEATEPREGVQSGHGIRLPRLAYTETPSNRPKICCVHRLCDIFTSL